MGERIMPAGLRGERGLLDGWLDYYRATLLAKCDGLSGEQLATRSCAPSPMSLLGLVRHMTEMERVYGHRLADPSIGWLYCTDEKLTWRYSVSTALAPARSWPGASWTTRSARRTHTRCAGSTTTWSRSTRVTSATLTSCASESMAAPANSAANPLPDVTIAGMASVGNNGVGNNIV
jgi:hypothetical protein